jgi:hypothetical protein
MMRATTLTGVSVRVGTVDGARAFTVDVISNPDGVPAVLGTLALPVATQSARTVALAAAVLAGTSFGVRMVRTAGAGNSSFDRILVLVEFEW